MPQPSTGAEQRLGGPVLSGNLRFCLATALLLRLCLLPAFWPHAGAVNDEVDYIRLAERVLHGQAIDEQVAWLWAPLYAWFLAGVRAISGSYHAVSLVQSLLSLVSVLLAHTIGRRLAGPRAGMLAAWLLALDPTSIYFATRVWSESLYTLAILGLVVLCLWAREGAARRAVPVGLALGAAVLLRGAATYLAPVLLLGFLWPEGESWRGSLRRRWRHGLVSLLCAAALVAPYSLKLSMKHDRFAISDATLGRMMWLGNNDFPPVTFDYALTGPSFEAVERSGSKWSACRDESPGIDVIEADHCDRGKGLAWIRAHPSEFLARIPLRIAQTVNPNSFFVRELRRGWFQEMPSWLVEGLVWLTAVVSVSILVLGTIGLGALGKGPLGALTIGMILYHLAIVAALAGLSRYRVAWSPLLMVYAAALVTRSGDAMNALRASAPRRVTTVLAGALVLAACSWLFPYGTLVLEPSGIIRPARGSNVLPDAATDPVAAGSSGGLHGEG